MFYKKIKKHKINLQKCLEVSFFLHIFAAYLKIKDMETNSTNDYTQFNGMVVKVSEKNYDGSMRTVVASFRQEENGFTLGHPYDTETKFMYAGASYNPNIGDIIGISPITMEEFQTWKREYADFHCETISQKGYDSCEEDIGMLKPYYEK